MALAAGATGCAFEAGAGRSGLTLSGDVAIVGAGMAGLACADSLSFYGLAATVYEASDRVGGRVFSMPFGGQVIERGGELIDTTHTTMRGYARELGLTIENYHRADGEISYFFDGAHVSEAVVVDEFRAFVPAMQDDLKTLTPPTADSFTEADEVLDYTTLAEYFETRGAGRIARKALDIAYEIEFGRVTGEQSCLNMLLFMHADRRSRFQPFGIWSDEKYHVVEGNQAIPEGLAARLPRAVEHGMFLTRVAKLSDGRVELTFDSAGGTVRRVHDAVVLTLPFSVLRDVELDPSLGLPTWKRYAIDAYSYGTNAKMMVGFVGRPWAAHGSNGTSYSDEVLANHQATWETNWTGSSATEGVLTDYSASARGASLDPRRTQREAEAFLADLDRIWPGAAAAARRDGRHIVAHIEPWPSNPLTKGSYTNNAPGYFTTICDNEAKPVGNLFFAGEHTSSFYEWQGFMEGAALSGLRAAGEVVTLLRGRA
jgi:monoamine oxidase